MIRRGHTPRVRRRKAPYIDVGVLGRTFRQMRSAPASRRTAPIPPITQRVFGYPNSMTKGIAYLTWGASSEITSFHDFGGHLDDLIYVRDLPNHDLGECAAC